MILDPRATAVPARLSGDVVVVGAGPAGITLALELASGGAGVVVLESGGTEVDDPDVDGIGGGGFTLEEPYDLATSRARVLGGTSALWGGHCRPLDVADFEPRSWVPLSGWPIAPDELAAGYAVAQRRCEVGPEPFDLDSWRAALDSAGVAVADVAGLTTVLSRRSPPTRFGPRYRRDLEEADGITVVLRTTATAVVSGAGGGSVARLDAVTAAGDAVEVTGGAYVLATGGLEVPRLLLASGVGGEMVGRCFLEHPHLQLAAVASTSKFEQEVSALAYGLPQPVGDRELLPAFALPPEVVAEERLLSGAFTLAAASGAERVDAVATLAADVVGGGAAAAEPVDLHLRAEQRPNPENRVELDPRARDRLGVPLLRVRWDVTDDDMADHDRATTLVGRAFGREGWGRVRLRRPFLGGGHHHMGTARMTDDPATGVVDRDLQVHGVERLFVASSAAFPTSGSANPTLTIVALAARLAEHLAARG